MVFVKNVIRNKGENIMERRYDLVLITEDEVIFYDKVDEVVVTTTWEQIDKYIYAETNGDDI